MGRILGMPEEVAALLSRECLQGLSGGRDEAREVTSGGVAQKSFELGEGHFDGIELGAVSRQVLELRAAGGDGLRHAADLVRGEIARK